MEEAELRDLLRKASRAERPTEGFVASLWSELELEPATKSPENAREHRHLIADVTPDRVNRPETNLSVGMEPARVRSGPVAALGAAAAVLLIGLLAVLLAPLSGPEQIASAPAPTEPAEEGALAAVDDARVEQSQSAIVKECDRLLVETRVAAVLRPGVVAEATSYRPSGAFATDVSAIELRSLVQAIEQLGETDEIRADIRVHHALTSATGALDQAILLIEMGEPTLAHDSINQAKMALGELASESALDGCLETMS